MDKKLPETHYYKVFEDENLTCNLMKFEFGKTYKIKGELEMCGNGFHACKELIDCFKYKPFHLSMRVCVVQLGGVTKTEGDKTVGETLHIVRELPFWEIDKLVNTGRHNIGYGNEGNYNKGNHNIGNHNIGNHNIGHSNEGSGNKGNRNTGSDNIGHGNEGDDNQGNNNKGNNNKGSNNKGTNNIGTNNIGTYNIGNCTEGDHLKG